MPRTARIKSPECTYHIIARGNNREHLFFDDSDRQKFLNTIRRFKIKYNFLLYTYTLMSNHVHLIINSNGEDISKIMQSINISYTYYFNKKYCRSGHLFQDRFKSIIIDDDSYIVNLSKYIHNNPVRANITSKADRYIWSSCRAYLKGNTDDFDIVDTDFILSLFSNDMAKSKANYSLYMNDAATPDYYDKQSSGNRDFNIKQHKCIGFQPIEIRNLLEDISGLYRIPIDEMLIKNNRLRSDIRYECLYIVRLKSKQSIKNIAKVFGDVRAASISYGINKVVKKMLEDENTYDRIKTILDTIA